jgi:putative ABC transport system ATP-binding protein
LPANATIPGSGPAADDGPPPSPDETDQAVFRLANVSKVWAGETSFALSIPALSIDPAEKLALVGFSGCGKSTLLDLLAMILKPDAAERFTFRPAASRSLDIGRSWQRKDLNSLARTRLRFMGYVLQTGGLLPFLSIRDNICLNRNALGLPADGVVEDLSRRLGIERHLDKLPGQLSVGERQRVAIARAMAHEPAVVLADEPTASLDPINAEKIMRLFTRLADDKGTTLIVATHEWERVGELGFRRITFELDDDAARGTVRARVRTGTP